MSHWKRAGTPQPIRQQVEPDEPPLTASKEAAINPDDVIRCAQQVQQARDALYHASVELQKARHYEQKALAVYEQAQRAVREAEGMLLATAGPHRDALWPGLDSATV